jgi:hypothetical protein
VQPGLVESDDYRMTDGVPRRSCRDWRPMIVRRIIEKGSKIDAGIVTGVRNRDTRQAVGTLPES